MIKPTKKYQLWINNSSEGWSYTEHDTLEEALLKERYGSYFMITKKVDIEIKEKGGINV